MTDHKLLPRVPTDEMVRIGGKAHCYKIGCASDYEDCSYCSGEKTKLGDSCADGALAAYQAMFDAAPAAEMPGWEEMVGKVADYVTGHSYDGNPFWLGRHGAIAVLTAARVPELLARVQRLEEALRPFAFFSAQYDRQPLRGQDDSFYGLHVGTEYEAILKLSDMQKARAALENKP